MGANSSNEVFGAPTAAARMGVTKELIARYCRQGRIPGASLVSGVWVIPAGGLGRFVKEHKKFKPGRPPQRKKSG